MSDTMERCGVVVSIKKRGRESKVEEKVDV